MSLSEAVVDSIVVIDSFKNCVDPNFSLFWIRVHYPFSFSPQLYLGPRFNLTQLKKRVDKTSYDLFNESLRTEIYNLTMQCVKRSLLP